MLQPQVNLLGRCHLVVLAATALYLVFAYPSALLPVLALLIGAVLSECVPKPLKRWLVGEMVMVTVGVASWWFLVREHPHRIDGWLRMLITYWLLIPSRPGLLRWMVSLVMAEALLLGTGRATVTEWQFGRGWFGDPAVLALPLLGLLPLAIGSLALDAWVHARAGARGVLLRGASWRFVVLPSLAICVLLLVVAPVMIPHHHRHDPRLDAGPARSGIRRPSIAPGEHQWVLRDPTPKARLLWEDTSTPLLSDVAYLRVFTLPHLVVDGPMVRWEAEPLDQLRRHGRSFDPQKPFAWIVRLPMGNDAVLRCEPGWGVDLDDLVGDRHGNRYAARLDDAPRAYRVNVADAVLVDAGPEDYLELPQTIRSLPWTTLIDDDWRTLPAPEAAARITAVLRDQCRYDIENLPTPAAQPGGLLRTFLWSDNPDHRRGHCQYFASAAAIMLRYLGHPTRPCAGFASNEVDTEGFTFRGLHAHAWLEVRDTSGGWHRVDPTPPHFLATRMTSGPLPNEDTTAPPPVQDWRTHVDRESSEQRRSTANARLVMGVIGVIVGLGCGMGVLLFWCRLRTPSTPRDPLQRRLDQETAALERLASELGIRVTSSTTLSTLATQLGVRTGIDLSPILRAHLAARYGDGPPPPPWPMAALRQAVARQRQQVQTESPRAP